MPAGDWDGLERLDAAALECRLFDNLEALMSGRLESQESEDAALEELPEPLRVLWLLSLLDFEVAQGGLSAYFMNSHGRHARWAIGALRAIGASGMAEVLEEARRVVERESAAWDARRRELDAQELFSIVYPYGDLRGTDELYELTSRFRDLSEAEWDLDPYLEANRDRIAAWARSH